MKSWLLPLAVLVTMCVSLFAGGCSVKGHEKTVLTYCAPFERKRQEMLDELFREFERDHPNITVRSINTCGPDCVVKPQTMIAAGTAPDIIWIWDMYFLEWADRGVFIDLEPYIAKDKAFDLEDFDPKAVFRCKGKITGLEANAETLLLYYNKELFDGAGVKYPEGPWDWDTLLKVAGKLTKATDGDGKTVQYGLFMDTWVDRVGVLIAQNGGRIFNDTYTECLINSPEAVEAIQWVVDLWGRHKVSPTPLLAKQQDIRQMFMSGKIAIFIDGSWHGKYLKEMKGSRWGVAPYIHGKQYHNYYPGFVQGISRDCKHPEKAWELLKFVLGPRVQLATSELEGSLPTLKSLNKPDILSDVLYKATQSEEFMPALLDSIEYARPQPVFVGYEEIRDGIMVPNLELAYIGHKSVKEVCDIIVRDANELLRARATGSQ